MENEKEGAQLKKDLQKFIDSARKELGKKRARPDQIMRELYTRVSAKLAQDRTHNISSALMYLSPYFETEFSNGSGRGLEQKLTKTLNEIFPSDKAAVSELKSALVSTTAGQSRALSELMTGFRKNSKADDARISELLNNDFVSLLAEKDLRKVAYDNKFKTYADFKYDFSNNTKLNGKTRDALIKEAADFLARIMAVRLERSDFQKAKDLRIETAKSFDFEASAEAGIKGTKQVIQGKDDTSMYDPWQFSASADLEFSKEWLRETGDTTQTFTKNTSFSVSAGVEASFSLKNQLLDGANPDEMKDKAQDKISEHKEKAGLDEDDEITLGDLPDETLKGTEIKNYNDKAKDIDSWNKLTHFFTDHKKGSQRSVV